MGPYEIEGTVKGSKQKVLVVLCTNAAYLDAKGHNLTGDAQFHATDVRESLTAVMLLPDTTAESEQYPLCPAEAQ